MLTARNLKLPRPTYLLGSRCIESVEIYPETDPDPYYNRSYALNLPLLFHRFKFANMWLRIEYEVFGLGTDLLNKMLSGSMPTKQINIIKYTDDPVSMIRVNN